MDSYVVGIAALCCGMTIGWIVFRFISDQKMLTLTSLTGVIPVVVGAAAIITFRKLGADTYDFLYYFIGVFLSVIFLGALNFKDDDAPR